MSKKSQTLVVRHLPCALSTDEKVDLLKHFGAESVRCMSQFGKLKHVAFATFPSQVAADSALNKLHQLELLGSTLIVEYAKNEHQKHFPHRTDATKVVSDSADSTQPLPKSDFKSKMETFSRKLHALSSDLGLDYIMPPMLKYNFPQPTDLIIRNIVSSLISVPKFYTQVLHLMNKMNLPAPFGPLLPQPPLQQDFISLHQPHIPSFTEPANPQPDQQLSMEEGDMEVVSTEESEIESEAEDHSNQPIVLPEKRISKKKKKIIKKPKLEQLMFMSTLPALPKESVVKPTEVFEVPQESVGVKTIQIHIGPMDADQPKEDATKVKVNVEQGGFGVIKPSVPEKPPSDVEEDGFSWEGTTFLTAEDLRNNRISSSEMKNYSVFKKYSPGDVSYRLYIKNISKAANEQDLFQIYGRYIDTSSEIQRNMFDIRLMKEGKMKGQAFVTLANEKQAIQAVKDTNGFTLKGKPIVVQFARSARPKEANASKA